MKIYLFLIPIILLLPFNIFAQSTKPTFTVEGEVLRPLQLSLDELSKMEITELGAKDKDGKEHNFKGVTLYAILEAAGVTLGKELRGENLSKYVLVKAVDGYQVVYSLPEIDPEFTNETILLSWEVDGHTLPKGEGPFRLVTPKDKRPARWIREITSIKVLLPKE